MLAQRVAINMTDQKTIPGPARRIMISTLFPRKLLIAENHSLPKHFDKNLSCQTISFVETPGTPAGGVVNAPVVVAYKSLP